MTDDDWDAGFAKSLAVFLNGDGIREPDARGERITDDSFLLLFNAHTRTRSSSPSPTSVRPSAGTWCVDTRDAPMLDDVDTRAVKTGETDSTWSRPVACSRAPARCSEPRPHAALATAHLPAAAARRTFGFAPPRRSCRTWPRSGVSHVYLSPILQAAPGSHARLRRRRPHAGSSTSSAGEPALRAAGRRAARGTGSASSSTSCPTTWPSPTPER